ncbi:MAG: hypothetical protein ACI9JM_001331 [Halioglobus sp.]|jgi:uncharacterized protein (TIGR02099 family)
MVVAIVVLAIYVSAGRLLMANVNVYREAILQELNVRFPFTLEARQVSGEWHSFSPVLIFTDLRLSFPDATTAPVELSEGRVSLHVLNSLRSLSLQLNQIVLTDLSLRGTLSEDGNISLKGFSSGGSSPGPGTWLQDFLLNIENISLHNNLLFLTMPNGDERELDFSLLLSRSGSHRQIDARLQSTAGLVVSILAKGVGNPLQPENFSGNVYMDIHTPDLGAAKAMLADGSPPFWAEGELDMQVWGTLDKGLTAVEARLAGTNLQITREDSTSRWPVEKLSLNAHFTDAKDHWVLHASDVKLLQNGVEVQLSQVQLDGKGSAVRARLVDVDLETLNDMASVMDGVPDKLLDALKTLQPRGVLPAAQLSVANIDEPATEWELSANFENIEAQPYKGAPGIVGARGYLKLAPGGGSVVLDSQPLVLDFPTIFREPLQFDELHGTLGISWNEEVFSLSSGLITATAEQGRAKVLFGLDVPLTENVPGIEMDLLVGLEGSHTRYLDSYLPYTLAPSLLNWLDESIGDGQIDQGAFLWRGSLRKEASKMRTVQLAFNATDTALDYHPQWPAVVLQEWVILIDDGAVSMWAERGSLLDSTITQLSVETRINKDKHLLLEVAGNVAGPAADALNVLNDSALTTIVGGTFSQWELEGEFEADLNLALNLSDKQVAPDVNVATRWRDTDVMIVPGKVPLTGMTGAFDYSTASGFTSTGLQGSIWGQGLTATVGQQHPAGTSAYDARASALEIDLATRVAMTDLQAWLPLKPLTLASGETAVAVKVTVAPGESAVLTATSALQGVALDLPQPWRLAPEQTTRLQFQMPLTKGLVPISLNLGEDLALLLNLEEGELQSGVLGINALPGIAQPGVFSIAGHTQLLQVDHWLQFVTEYFGAPDLVSAVSPVSDDDSLDVATLVAAAELGVTPDTETAGDSIVNHGPPVDLPLEVIVDKLLTERLIVMDQQFQNAALSLALKPATWTFSLYCEWLQGSIVLDRREGSTQVILNHLDLDRLVDLDVSKQAGGDSTFKLPAMEVTLKNLYQSEKRLGELSFSLVTQGALLQADNIVGELAKLSLDSEKPAQLKWLQGADGHTELKADLSFADLGETLEYFGYQRMVQTREGEFDVNLRWPGTPIDFSLEEGKGSMLIDMGAGNFPEVPPGASGALKVAGILNLADIVARLSMSGMIESGIPFSEVQGEIYLHSGTMEVARMDVQGAASFQFSGVSEVANESLSGELVAILPVANNLAWVAALAASLPVAAGVYIVSKVFNKQMNRLTSAVYSIEGTWNEPVVRFDRVFDNTSHNNADSAVKKAVEADAAPPLEQGVEEKLLLETPLESKPEGLAESAVEVGAEPAVGSEPTEPEEVGSSEDEKPIAQTQSEAP